MLQLNFDPFPVLTTERLLLRAITHDDAPDMLFLRSNEEVMRYIHKPKPKTIDDVMPLIEKIKGMIANNEAIAWAITIKDDPKMIGHISYHIIRKEHYRAEVGYMLHPGLHGTGLMDEALKAVLQYGFGIGLHSVEAYTSPNNAASRKLLERNKFIQEGHLKENLYWEGTFIDSVLYSLLKHAR